MGVVLQGAKQITLSLSMLLQIAQIMSNTAKMVVFLNSRSIYREQVCSKLLSTCCSGHPCHTLILYPAEKRNFIYTAANIFLEQHISHVAKTTKKQLLHLSLKASQTESKWSHFSLFKLRWKIPQAHSKPTLGQR